jgi:hypothetical protein
MNAPFPLWRVQFGGWIKTHPYTVAAAVLLLVLAVGFCRRQQSEWEEVYIPAANHLRKGEDMYRREEGYWYPPFMAWTALPFLALPPPLPRLAWLLANGVCLLALLRWSWRLAGGGRLQGSSAAKGGEHVAAVLGCLCGVFYIQNCLAHQQTDLVLAAALAGGCLLLVRGRPLLAATALGLAAACKCTALLWIPYLLWRRRPLAAGWLLVVALGLNLLPDLVSSAPEGKVWLQTYTSRFLEPLTAADHYVGTWGSDPAYNQSLAGMGQRWCTTTWTWGESDCTIDPRPPLLRPQWLRAVVYGGEVVLLLAVFWSCGRPLQKIGAVCGERDQALECGIVLLLMLLLSPMSSKAHFGTLLVPGFCLARAAVGSRSRLLWSVLLAAVVLAVLSNKDPLGERLYTLSLWYGVVTWETLLLLAGCVLALRQGQAAMGAQPPCPAVTDGSARRGPERWLTPFSARTGACRASP